MIINKVYEINFIDFDSAILEMAEDLKNGYTFSKVERLPLEACSYAKDLKPSLIITLRNKKVDELR